MKYRVISLLAIVVLLSLSACMQDHPNASDVRKEVKVSASIDGAQSQSVKTRATNNSWEAGDVIGLFMKKSDEVLTTSALALNAKYATNNGNSSFNAVDESNKIYFPFHNEEVDFIAYYPYKETLSDLSYPVDVSDQSDLSKIDLMYSNDAKKINSTSENVKLTFFHQLSNIILNISMIDAPEDEDLSELNVKITDVNTKASFSLVDGTLSSEAEPKSVSFNVSTDGKTAQAILLPNESLTNSCLVFTTKESSYSFDLSQASIDSLNMSTKYTFNVTLKPGQVEIEGITTTIEDWTNGGSKDITADEVKSENSSTDDGESEEGEPSNNPPDGDGAAEEDGSLGDGTEENPYNVNQVEDNIGETNVWVYGYIVGYYSISSMENFVYGFDGARDKFIAIAFKPTETNYLKTIQVDLIEEADSSIKGKINLKDNPTNFKKRVNIYGNIKRDLKGVLKIYHVKKAILIEPDTEE